MNKDELLSLDEAEAVVASTSIALAKLTKKQERVQERGLSYMSTVLNLPVLLDT